MGSPEKIFQEHICDYFSSVHRYAVLDEGDITDREHYFAEGLLLAFIRATQKASLEKLQKEYRGDSEGEIIRALKEELRIKPLWKVFRDGLSVRGVSFALYYPKPRSGHSKSEGYSQNRIAYKKEFLIKGDGRIDIVLYLNGLPIITIELKHENAGQNVYDAVQQYVERDQSDSIFSLAFLHIAADTTQVKVATNCSKESNFRWFNQGLENRASNDGEYPIEFLYAEALGLDAILSYLGFYLIYVPQSYKEGKSSQAYTIFPRYHQLRSTDRLSSDTLAHFEQSGRLGKNYLINHSAGSGKTLTISWMADKLHSLFDSQNQKLFNIIFLLTDRRDLDKNITDEMVNLTHLKDIIGYANSAKGLAELIIKENKQIIVSTQHKFSHIISELASEPSLKSKRVAFLIDEAHRSQEGKMSKHVKAPFRDEADNEETVDESDELAGQMQKAKNDNLCFVAFTATPSRATVTLFGDPFDVYSEEEAIEEGYILDVAQNIISFETLYHINKPLVLNENDEKVYPAGIVAKALKNLAYADEGLIQYKAEIILRLFDEKIAHLIDGKAKAMVVTSSRVAGLFYFRVFQEKLRDKKLTYPCGVLYAFSDFIHPQTNELITEKSINDLGENELIEDRFARDEYRILVVANKFQTGFNEPLLAGMFLDKPVNDINAVQTLSRLNRTFVGKSETIVVDFTNNSKNIFKAFNKYRKNAPYTYSEPSSDALFELVKQIERYGFFTDEQKDRAIELSQSGNDADMMSYLNTLKGEFTVRMPSLEERKSYVYMVEKAIKQFDFLCNFYTFEGSIIRDILFYELISDKLIKIGGESELMREIGKLQLSKAAVKYLGSEGIKPTTPKTGGGIGGGIGNPPAKITIDSAIESLVEKFSISEDEAAVIREIFEEKIQDSTVLAIVTDPKNDSDFLHRSYFERLRVSIVAEFDRRGYGDRLYDEKYSDDGAILDTMGHLVIDMAEAKRYPSKIY